MKGRGAEILHGTGHLKPDISLPFCFTTKGATNKNPG